MRKAGNFENAIYAEESGVMVQRIMNLVPQEWATFALNYPLQPGITYRIELLKISNSNIHVGIGTKKLAIDSLSWSNPAFLSYQPFEGIIFEEGNSRKVESERASEGSALLISV